MIICVTCLLQAFSCKYLNIKITENVEFFVMDYVCIQNSCLFLKHPLNNEATKETTHDIFKPKENNVFENERNAEQQQYVISFTNYSK